MVIFRLLFMSLICFCTILLTSFTLNAQTDFVLESGNIFTAKLSSEYGQISNFLHQNKDEKSTRYIKVEPSVFIQTQFSRHLIQLEANISHYKFNEFAEDDHSNLSFKPKYLFKLDHNKTLFADFKLQEEYEYRGTGLSLGNATWLTTGDDKKRVVANIGYLYGQVDSVAKFKLSIGQEDFRYKTRRIQNQALDRVDHKANVSVDYLLSGKTYFAVDLAYIQSNFQHDKPLNKDKYALLVGMKWQSTAITQLQALVGYQSLSFEDQRLTGDHSFKWRFDMNWQPTLFSNININTQRDYETANQITERYRVVDSTNLNVTHQLTDYFQTSIAIGYKQEELVFLDQINNEDYFYSALKFNYQRNDWLTLFARFTFTDLEASDDNLNNQRNSLSLGFSVTI
jgi:hypothetical protein